jgi:hypothetical protein
MGYRIKVELEDVEGHGFRYSGEDLTGQGATIRLQGGTEVQGHVIKRGEDLTGEEAEGHALRVRGEDMTGEDTEGHLFKRIDLEVDDAQANLLRAATDKGELIYVRFPDGAEIQGHAYRVKY